MVADGTDELRRAQKGRRLWLGLGRFWFLVLPSTDPNGSFCGFEWDI